MKLKSYAQHGEDDLIWKFFDKQKTGLIIEVGAFDGKYLSNSYALEKLGWKAICIEPLPFYYNLLCKNKPKSTNINSAITGDETQDKIIIYEDIFGVYSSINSLNIELIKDLSHARKIEYTPPKKREVNATTLNKLLNSLSIQSNDINCLSIDVEGFELNVLKGLDLKKYRPKLLIVEANNLATEKELKSYLQTKNYFFARKNSVNYFFVSHHLYIKKLQSIKIDCSPPIFKHPKGYNYSEQSTLLNPLKLLLYKFLKKISNSVQK
jgi:FkbM family methyltransferase